MRNPRPNVSSLTLIKCTVRAHFTVLNPKRHALHCDNIYPFTSEANDNVSSMVFAGPARPECYRYFIISEECENKYPGVHLNDPFGMLHACADSADRRPLELSHVGSYQTERLRRMVPNGTHVVILRLH
ncbi:hypothetical protein RRG08_042760 [Elysia crispata]|uniref:Uncharacterized protein n=1 Tax=Elysia crispata TaxID=231223 RepID=A0AAE0XQB2_9GAST|nr:hypothetical protein RRG08_042760 [Elysia crispata]